MGMFERRRYARSGESSRVRGRVEKSGIHDDAGTQTPNDAGGIDGRGVYCRRYTINTVECRYSDPPVSLRNTEPSLRLTYLPRSDIPLHRPPNQGITPNRHSGIHPDRDDIRRTARPTTLGTVRLTMLGADDFGRRW